MNSAATKSLQIYSYKHAVASLGLAEVSLINMLASHWKGKLGDVVREKRGKLGNFFVIDVEDF